MNEIKNVLCVDDNDDNNEMLSYLFKHAGFQVTTCRNGEECLQSIKNNDYSAVILDLWLPDKNGIEVCREIRKIDPQLPVIFYSADALDKSREMAMIAGANAYIIKPTNLDDIVSTVNQLIKLRLAKGNI